MKKQLLTILFLSLFVAARAQDLRGVVRDEEQQPLVGATVLWEGTTVGAVTDAEGKYRLHRVKGRDRLAVGFLGYREEVRTIEPGTVEADFTLQAEGVDIESVVIESTVGGNYVKHDGVLKGEMISFAGLCKMACCNLAESFENSASVEPARSRCSAWPAPTRKFSTRTAPSCGA